MDEEQQQNRMVLVIGILAVIIALATLAFAYDSYVHKKTAVDCSKPFDYAVCKRAVLPSLTQVPGTIMTFLAVICTVILAILLVYVGYHASVVEQANIITAQVNVQKPPVQAPAAVQQGASTVRPAAPAQPGAVAEPSVKPLTGINFRELI
jgi:hypothetical protein